MLGGRVRCPASGAGWDRTNSRRDSRQAGVAVRIPIGAVSGRSTHRRTPQLEVRSTCRGVRRARRGPTLIGIRQRTSHGSVHSPASSTTSRRRTASCTGCCRPRTRLVRSRSHRSRTLSPGDLRTPHWRANSRRGGVAARPIRRHRWSRPERQQRARRRDRVGRVHGATWPTSTPTAAHRVRRGCLVVYPTPSGTPRPANHRAVHTRSPSGAIGPTTKSSMAAAAAATSSRCRNA